MANVCADGNTFANSLVLENLSDVEWNIAGKVMPVFVPELLKGQTK